MEMVHLDPVTWLRDIMRTQDGVRDATIEEWDWWYSCEACGMAWWGASPFPPARQFGKAGDE